MNSAARVCAWTFPYALAVLAALALVTMADAAEPPAAASAGSSPTARHATYAACRDQAQPSPAADAQARRAQQHHHDPAGRSQRPAWVQRTQVDIEHCLRGGPDTALATRGPARYAKGP
jgi:hypothetical protein